MEVSALTNAATTTATASTTDAARDATSDFETFLKLLTTQLKNQDPLKPLDSTDFVAQLASFSGVEQQVRTNETLEDLKSVLGQNNASGLASWIGSEVRAERSVAFDGTSVDIYSAPASGADRADLAVIDASGNEVQRHQLPLESGVYEWAGAGDDGVPLANGTYSLVIESFRNGEVVNRADVASYGKVRLEGGGTTLVLDDGTEVSSDSVDAIRAPDNS